MKKMLIVTTINDLSIPLFMTQKIKQKISIDFCFFHESLEEIRSLLSSNVYDFIYIKDPFNYVYDDSDIQRKINLIINNKRNSYLVDKIETVDDVYLEDKWLQYQIYSEFMPQTKLMSEFADSEISAGIYDSLAKKRISSRSNGIYFDLSASELKETDNFIVQKKINIEKEYRIYVVFNQILPLASVRRSKTQLENVKIIDSENLDLNTIEFVKKVIAKNKFDFVGLDVAKCDDGLYLLEVNRSCLFNGYLRVTGKNLAELFVDKLLETSSKS